MLWGRRVSRSGIAAPLISAPMARLTGERPMVGATPDSLLAFHDAGYREMSERLGPGTVLDVGCGVGDQTARLAGIGRLVIGVDYDAQTAIDAAHASGGPSGLRFAAMDGGRIGARSRSIDWVCSSHIIEHFVAPEQHVAELARVATDDGTVLVITPEPARRLREPVPRLVCSRVPSSSRCSACSSTT